MTLYPYNETMETITLRSNDCMNSYNETNEANTLSLYNNCTYRYGNESVALLPIATLQTGEVIQLIIYLIILVVGCIGNTLVILYFGFKKKVKQRFSHYLINLAFVDLLTSIFTPINFMYVIVSQHRWRIGMLSCISLSSVGPLTVNVSAWIITSIAIERHRGIKNPLRQRYSRTRIYLTMLFIWIISIATLIPYMMSLNITQGNSTNYNCTPVWRSASTEFTYSLVLLVLQSILPAFMMVVMFVSIYKAVTARGRFLSVHYTTPSTSVQSSLLRLQRHSSDEQRKNLMEQRDKKLFNMLTIALVIFIVCSIPYNIFYPALVYIVRIKNLLQDLELVTNINVWLSMLVTINSCINFFIYAGVDKSFKSYCKSILFHKTVKDSDHSTVKEADGRQSFVSRLSINLDLESAHAYRRNSNARQLSRQRSGSNHGNLFNQLNYNNNNNNGGDGAMSQHDDECAQNTARNSERTSPV